MTHRHRLFLLASVGAMTGLVVAAACSFPEPQFVPDEGGTSGDGNAVDTGSDANAVDGDTTDGGKFADVVEPKDAPPIDANGEKPPIDAAGCVCDCDHDGYRSDQQDAAACEAGMSNAIDCDDLDPRAHPEAGFVKDQPTKETAGDWNCDKAVNREIPAVNVNCADYSGLNILGCNGTEGFANDPGCGETASYLTCKANGTTCAAGNNVKTTQGCK